MNRKGKKKGKGKLVKLRVWTFEEARAALPYLKSIVGSLREHRLEARFNEHRARKLADRPGRPDRGALIAGEEAVREATRAEARYREAEKELQRLSVFCLDPIDGIALLPFVQDGQLAWFIYELFNEEQLTGWRLHTDPVEECRPLTAEQKGRADDRMVV